MIHPHYPTNNGRHSHSDEDEGTLASEHDRLNATRQNSAEKQNAIGGQPLQSQTREEENRLTDDLAMLQAERVVSNAQSGGQLGERTTRSTSMRRSRSRAEPVDQFDVNTNPIHEKAATFKPPENPAGRFAKTFKKIHESNFLIRYFSYIVPVVVVLLIPLLIGALLFKEAHVGGVELLWFSVWLEIVWLTLWSGRVGTSKHTLPTSLLTKT